MMMVVALPVTTSPVGNASTSVAAAAAPAGLLMVCLQTRSRQTLTVLTGVHAQIPH